jgi:hypothetical protein
MIQKVERRQLCKGLTAWREFGIKKELSWARSSVGRALEWHSRGQGFESPRVHQIF